MPSSHHTLSNCFHRCLRTLTPFTSPPPFLRHARLFSIVTPPPTRPCPRRRHVDRLLWQPAFSICRNLQQQRQDDVDSSPPIHPIDARNRQTSGRAADEANSADKKRAKRRGKNPLRAVAIKAQKQPDSAMREHGRRHVAAAAAAASSSSAAAAAAHADDGESASLVTAVCVAEAFDMDAVTRILSAHGYSLDPDGTGFEAQEVVHARARGQGDIFVFPSGTVVAWSMARDVVESLAAETLLPAAEEPHPASLETEDLYYVADPEREASTVKGDDTVVLGTRRELLRGGDRLDTTLAQIAFSSGLAQSTKLAVLEACLTDYFKSMRRLPENLSRGSDLRLNNRRFILQKTGELLSLRAQLNHYSELTDSLPDIFWENRGSDELNLESYFDQVGKALDIRVRIRILNEKMDYAQEMASVLREMAAQKHGTRLEWIIIILIAVEVMFELRRVYIETTASVPPA